jgi:hypothetical protein
MSSAYETGRISLLGAAVSLVARGGRTDCDRGETRLVKHEERPLNLHPCFNSDVGIKRLRPDEVSNIQLRILLECLEGVFEPSLQGPPRL